MMPEWLWPALAMVLVLEGIGPLLFPNRWRAYLLKLSQESATSMQTLGLLLVGSGMLWLWWLL